MKIVTSSIYQITSTVWKENQFDGFNRNGILAICVHKPNVSINMLFCINWHGKEKEIAIIIIILPYDNPTVIVGYDGQFERSKKRNNRNISFKRIFTCQQTAVGYTNKFWVWGVWLLDILNSKQTHKNMGAKT